MNLGDTSRLLTYIHQFGGREPNELMVMAWQDLLDDVDYDQGKSAVRELVKSGKQWIEVADILGIVRDSKRENQFQIEADVRVAKLKGIVGPGWPKSQALPPAEAERLLTARTEDLAKLGVTLGEDVEPPPPAPRRIQAPDYGTVGKEVPRG